MSNISKAFSLFIIVILAVSSLIVVDYAYAQVGVTTPSMPSFGVMYEPHTYYVSPTYGVDPLTGKAVMTYEGYYKVNRFVILSISNQPFEPYTDSKGNPIDLYYDIMWKAHNTDSWKDLLPATARFSQNKDFYLTAINIGFKGNDPSGWNIDVLYYVPGNQIDFQVKASIGYYTADNVFVGETSGWSSTQTLTIDAAAPTATPNTSTLPSQNPTVTPSQPDAGTSVLFGWGWAEIVIVVLLGVVAVLLVFVVVFLRKRSVR